MTSKATHHDWFISAVVTDGSVGQCLNQVLDELKRKESFVAKLRQKIGERNDSKIDPLTEIVSRIRVMENTLKFRLSILAPDRRGAWFRQCAAVASGPFSGAVLQDPIFVQYDETKTAKIRANLIDCWTQKNLLHYPLRATESCVWKHLLAINFDLNELGDLGEWSRLEAYPEAIPPDFESRALKAFMNNVKTEYVSAQERLKFAFLTLLEASDQFWSHAPKQKNSQARDAEPYDGFYAADAMRQEFKKRRSTPTIKRPIGKSAHDIECLKFMGFDDFPDAETLKQKYHALALEMHPDRQGGNEARFKMLAKSFKHLSRMALRSL